MEDKKQALINILRNGMKIEYASIWHYPRLARLIKDKEAARIFNQLGQDSVQHASQVSQMLRSLGANPEGDLLSSVREPEPGDIVPILKNMLVAENEAARLYKEADAIADEYAMRNWLQQQVKEERQHAALVKQVLEKLEG